ncbi:hypothetical protein PR202_ga29407 [Eleusine coracana subsp. coracana]|uniref:Subtilisin-like protease fibronectin type-III domain-containing protein n=1 Tax=Eleusine coracana subsp. coracana TaxID=191504 RepID=A0AAV5DJW9_ELECO|nr:hypothetical protein PR202_ga29407 [Eleusine coracana subsp. coracana]
MFMPGFGNCTRTLPGGPAGLNYPSFVVVFDDHTHFRTLTRTVTTVSEKAETYTVSYAAPDRIKVTVTPIDDAGVREAEREEELHRRV